MIARLLVRIFWSIMTLLATAVLTFLLINVVPGDAAHLIAGPKASPEVIAQIREAYHFDQPLIVRLGHYLAQLARGDLGQSYVTGQSVTQAILTRLPATTALSAVAVAMWMIIAVPLGVLTARLRGSWFDRGALIVATVSLSLPAFWLARMMQYWLAYKLGWFPVALFRSFVHLLLPGMVLAILFIGYYARLIHTNMCEVLQSEYIRTARAKGVSERAVLFKHALRNAMIPVVTILGMDVAGLLGGVLFVENVFALPGIGTLAVQSVFNLDVPMIMGTVLFSALLVVVANLIVDISYRWIDPRIQTAV
ncbi:MAG TPA: ABC transporter permease [Pirellulales bacterium]|jgi:peptide/nickel transport system permease protein|nr:ABC transporter permease [Pirellulales bacterium]